jgi:predicted RNase H-like HicB family nuclease
MQRILSGWWGPRLWKWEVRNNGQMRQIKIVVEKHADGHVAYPVGLKGVVVGEGDTYDTALADVQSAIRFHIDTFGPEVLDLDSPVPEVFIAQTPPTPHCRVPTGGTKEERA